MTAVLKSRKGKAWRRGRGKYGSVILLFQVDKRSSRDLEHWINDKALVELMDFLACWEA
jgi:hypothetical protein